MGENEEWLQGGSSHDVMCLQWEDECVSEDGLCITDVRLCGGLMTGGSQRRELGWLIHQGALMEATLCTVQGIKESQVNTTQFLP